MFSPPPNGRRHIKPYRLAPIQREKYLQDTLGDSPFYRWLSEQLMFWYKIKLPGVIVINYKSISEWKKKKIIDP